MKTNQLSLPFDFPQPERENFWKSFFGFEPKVGGFARIDIPITFCETFGRDAYCASMRVKVLSSDGDKARCETTEEWMNACGCAGNKDSVNTAGNIWIVDIVYLAPIFNNKQAEKAV